MKQESQPSEPVPGPRHEIMSAERTFPLESRAGGSCREWIDYLHQELGNPLSQASEPMKRLFVIYQRENRVDRLVNRLVGIERTAQEELLGERAAAAVLARENKFIQRMLDARDRQLSSLQAEFAVMRRDWAWRLISALRNDLGRFRRMFRPAVAGSRASLPGG